MSNLQEPLSEEECDRLDDFLGRVVDGLVPNVEAFDGFITALAVCPELVMPSEFLPLLQQGEKEDGDLVFSDLEEAQDFTDLVMRHWNDVNATFGRDEVHMPILIENDDGVATGNDWARGFHCATRLRLEVWSDILADDERSGGMVAILALLHEHDPDPGMRPYDDPVTPEQREALIAGVIDGPLSLYRAFAPERRRAGGAMRPARSTKIRPNAPCPCGSGKKHKKCCGNVTMH